MFNRYTNTAICRGSRAASLSFSLNDCPENCSSSFNGGYPSSSCCCCSCCCCSCSCCSSIRINTVNCSRLVPVNPSSFYGFRQSTLIQLPLSKRRLILSSWAPVGNLGPTRSTYGRLACTREVDRIRDQGMKSIRKGIGLWGFYSGMSGREGRYVFHKVNDACADSEAVISLVSEELCEEDFSVSERRKKKVSSSSSKKGKVRESVVDMVWKERVYGRQFDGHSWDGLENVEAREWKEHCRVKRQGKDFVKSEDSRLRKGGTIGSSYYSCSDLGDSEVKTKRREECGEVGLIESEKESRRVGVLTINKQTKDELERQQIEKHQYLESGRKDDIEVETSAGLDLRKKSNKKLRKELIEEIVSGRESVLNQSRLSEAHISSLQTGSSMKKQYNYRAGESVSDVNSSFDYSQTDNRVSETSHPSYKYERVTGNSGFVDEKTTSYSSKVDGNEEHVVSDSEFCRTCGWVTSGSLIGSSNDQQPKFQKIQSDSATFISSIVETNDASGPEERSSLTQKSANEVSQQHNKLEHLVASNQISLRKSEYYTKRADAAESYKGNTSISRRHAKLSEIDSTDTRLTSTIRQQSDTRTEKQEETTLIETSLKEVNEKSHQESCVAISQTEIMRRNQKRIEIVDTGHSNVQDTSRTQQQQEARVKGSEENTVLISSQLAKGERYQTDAQVMSGKQSREESKVLSGSSQVHIDETIVNSSSASEERLHYQQNYLTKKVKETREHIKETIKQTELRYQVQPPVREPSIVEKETSRYPWVTSTSQVRIEEIGEEEDQGNLPSGPSPRLAQPPPSIEVHPVYAESASRFSSQDSSTNSEGESSIYTDPLATDESPHVDLLGSAERMDNLYHQVIGDFVENIRHEESTSVIGMEKKLPERQLLTEGVEYTYEKSGSGTGEEPTDETLTLQQPPAREASENAATPHNGIVRRSGRALWNVAAKILRLRWGVLSESRKSTVKSSGQSSLSDSVGSETLLSGYDPNDAPGGDMKMGFLRVPLEPSSTCQPLPVRTSTHSPRDKPKVSNMGDITRLAVDSALSPSFGGISGETNIELNVGGNTRLTVDSSLSPSFGGVSGETSIELNVGGNAGLSVDSSLLPLFGGVSGETNMELNVGDNTRVTVDSSLLPSFGGGSGETNIELNVDEMSSQATASMDWTQSAAMQFRRSHRRSDAIYELREGGTEATGSSTVDQIKGDLDTSLTVVSDSEENENVAVQEGRNLLRSNQVMKERFDEWGEAYRLESEQRKIDETFMREALEEAKKAVDMWEFPVGAVLAQHGKVIARGHNLVEDLRDSTAHAEILCIREASSILRTWRLSEATLYVTLEPCAMCAGAILQARVGTLVYGAPNKLLGADGSWVRLFPGSVDGEGGSESMANPEGPVHPFHPKMTIRRGILEVECAELMQQSFKLRRKKDKTTEQPDEKRSNRKVHHPSKLLHKMHHMFLFCL